MDIWIAKDKNGTRIFERHPVWDGENDCWASRYSSDTEILIRAGHDIEKDLEVGGWKQYVIMTKVEMLVWENRYNHVITNKETEDVICPWCGYIEKDLNNYAGEGDNYECPKCCNCFSTTTHVTYSTIKVNE